MMLNQPGAQPAYPAQQGGFQAQAQPQQTYTPPGGGFQAQAPAAQQTQPYNAMMPQAPQHGQMISPAAAAAAIAAANNRSSDTYGFHLKVGEVKQITFLDGDLTPEGMFNVGHANEHNIRMGAKDFESYQCLSDYARDCPMCAYSRDVKNGPVGFQSLKGYFTIIDHTGYVNNEGKTIQHQRKLYKASKKTIAQLGAMVQALGQRDGHYSLAGRCFQVSRTGDKAAGVGDSITPIDRYDVQGMLQSLRSTYPERADTFQIVDYSKVLNYIDENQIYAIFQKLGSASQVPFGHATGVGTMPQTYGAPSQQQTFGAPPAQQVGAPPQQQFGAPPHQQVGAPPQQQFGAPPQQNFQAAPPNNGGYQQAAPGGFQQGAVPQQGGGNPPWPTAAPAAGPGVVMQGGVQFAQVGAPAHQGGPAYGADVQPPNFQQSL